MKVVMDKIVKLFPAYLMNPENRETFHPWNFCRLRYTTVDRLRNLPISAKEYARGVVLRMHKLMDGKVLRYGRCSVVFSCTIVVYCRFVTEVISEQRLKSVSQRHDDETNAWVNCWRTLQGRCLQSSNNFFLTTYKKTQNNCCKQWAFHHNMHTCVRPHPLHTLYSLWEKQKTNNCCW